MSDFFTFFISKGSGVAFDLSGFQQVSAGHGEKMPYNDIQPWKYHKLHEVFGNNGWGVKVATESELESALQQAEQNRDKLAFIEVVMDKMDSPEILLKMLHK
ncbi:hypothetical protein NUACC21_03200 [Scytonema sp. NUACC21]